MDMLLALICASNGIRVIFSKMGEDLNIRISLSIFEFKRDKPHSSTKVISDMLGCKSNLRKIKTTIDLLRVPDSEMLAKHHTCISVFHGQRPNTTSSKLIKAKLNPK